MHGEENGACREVPLGKNQLELRYSAPFSWGAWGGVSRSPLINFACLAPRIFHFQNPALIHEVIILCLFNSLFKLIILSLSL